MSGYYSAERARRSLRHFGVGKLVSGGLGVALILVTARAVPTADFGAFVALQAILEIFYLVSGLGLSYRVQRQLPELRLTANTQALRLAVWRMQLLRIGLAAGFALPLVASMSVWQGVLDMHLGVADRVWFGVVLVAGATMRFQDEILQSLLMQGVAQIQLVGRNLLRLAVLAWYAVQQEPAVLAVLVILEAVVSMLAMASTAWTTTRHLEGAAQPTSSPARQFDASWAPALKFFGAQTLAQTYGPNAVKLVVSATLGANATAVLGFAQQIADTLRNYSPAFLLAGWVRPLIVARYVEQGVPTAIQPLTGLVIIASVMGTLPFVGTFAAFGQEASGLLSGGRYLESGPFLGPLVFITLLQGVRVVLGMVCVTLQRPGFMLAATAIGTITLPASMLAASAYGLWGVVIVLAVSELLWLATVLGLLKLRIGTARFVDPSGLIRASLLGLMVFGALTVLAQFRAGWPVWMWLSLATVATLAYWGLGVAVGAISVEQKSMLARFLKLRSSGA